MSQVKERPILFSGPMVRAILEGRKTVTRRAISPKLVNRFDEPRGPADVAAGYPFVEFEDGYWPAINFCPYGQPGERLWVRETCFINDYRQAGVPIEERAGVDVVYRADPLPDWEGEESLITWRPSIHMPRWASRILLEITDVRVERLQDISEQQALAEGVMSAERDIGPDGNGYSPLELFGGLWVKLNGMDSWSANPWVWVVEFKRVQP